MSTEKGKRGRGSQQTVVVEIGNEWIKAIRVVREPGGLTLAGLELEKLDPARGAGPARVGELLRRLGAASASTIGCLPRQAATIRTLDLPSTDAIEVADMVDLQVGKLTPYTKDEIISDFRIVGSGRDGYTRVLLVIVQRSLLRNRFSLMEEAGVRLGSMAMSTEGVLNWVRKAYPPGATSGAIAVLDVDTGYSDCVIVAQNELAFTRSIMVGAQHLQADEAARERLVRDVANALQTFAAESPGARIERVLVTGAGFNAGGLDAALRERLEVPVESVDCCRIFRKIPKQPVMGQAPHDVVSLTALVGMAIDPERLECRLVPESVRLRQDLVGKARRLAVLGCLVVAVMVLLSLLGSLRYFLRYDRLESIRARVGAHAAEVRAIEQKQKLIEIVRDRNDPRISLVSLMADLQKSLPAPGQITLDGMEFDAVRGSLQIVGTGGSTPDVRGLVKTLEQSPLLTDVREDGSTTREANGRYRFRLVCRLETPHAG